MEKVITYRAADGSEFETEEACLAHESMFTIPTGVVLLNKDKEPITEIDGYTVERVFFAYLPVPEAVEWFIDVNNYYGAPSRGSLAAGEHCYYGDDDCWHSYEEDMRNAESAIKEFDAARNLKSS